ncbi:hypothetical protein [Anaerophaga thermohalophila]|uniref:hypothetical protein n=1 Tax=Anaerophaga thermohalophila TaxID=177400 RepID=UPI000237CDDA|nr:hypothetical protein [Anaerophaga thermohalophila]
MKPLEQQVTSLRLHDMERRWKALVETRRQHELTLNEGLEILLQVEQQDRKLSDLNGFINRPVFVIRPPSKGF